MPLNFMNSSPLGPLGTSLFYRSWFAHSSTGPMIQHVILCTMHIFTTCLIRKPKMELKHKMTWLAFVWSQGPKLSNTQEWYSDFCARPSAPKMRPRFLRVYGAVLTWSCCSLLQQNPFYVSQVLYSHPWMWRLYLFPGILQRVTPRSELGQPSHTKIKYNKIISRMYLASQIRPSDLWVSFSPVPH